MKNALQEKLFVFDIQRGSYHDGPGMRTTVFLKGCNLSCFWCQNPESQSTGPELMYFKNKCIHCGCCINECSQGAVQLANGEIYIQRSSCLTCGACAKVCPTGAMEISGRAMSIEEVMQKVLEDKPFYELSGGGVTLSGVEPLLQKSSVALLKAARQNGIHTAVETAGNLPLEVIKKAMPFVDLFLYDVKCMDDDLHKKVCGASNKRILQNLKFLAKTGAELCIRTPVIPNVNDTKDGIQSIRSLARSLKLNEPEFLRFNKLGAAKYDALGRVYKARELPLFEKETWDALTMHSSYKTIHKGGIEL